MQSYPAFQQEVVLTARNISSRSHRSNLTSYAKANLSESYTKISFFLIHHATKRLITYETVSTPTQYRLTHLEINLPSHNRIQIKISSAKSHYSNEENANSIISFKGIFRHFMHSSPSISNTSFLHQDCFFFLIHHTTKGAVMKHEVLEAKHYISSAGFYTKKGAARCTKLPLWVCTLTLHFCRRLLHDLNP